MATALTGSTGWTGLHPFQLGGPPLVSNYDQPLPSRALPYIAHVYTDDGVTSLGTLTVLDRPPVHVRLANGGPDGLTLSVSSRSPVPVYGQILYGQALYGAQVVHGNVVRLSEQGGDGRFIYAGIVESLPDVVGPNGTSHQIVLTPFAAELGRTATQLLYTTPTDVAQVVRDAVVLTQHCYCDQVSVPVSTGFLLAQADIVDFRGQQVQGILDTLRSIAGPSWFWHCDVHGRVWFQPQGSAATVTLMAGQHYSSRETNGGDITARKNQVLALGEVPLGGNARVSALVTGPSAAPGPGSLGIRALDPPLMIPGVADQPTLTAIANGVLGTLDQTWVRVRTTTLPALGQRVHGSRPGGAMLRYWEPVRSPLPQSAIGSGAYTGPFIVQSVTTDGAVQDIEAGSAPLTSQSDIDNMVKMWASRAAAVAVQLPVPTLSGHTVLQTSNATSSGGRLSVVDLQPAIRTDFGNLPAYVDPNGVSSPAEYGMRAIAADGTLIFDSAGVVAVMQSLGQVHASSTFSQNFSSSTPAVVTGASVTFTLARNLRVLVLSDLFGFSSTGTGYGMLYVDGAEQSGVLGGTPTASFAAWLSANVSMSGSIFWSQVLPAGSHTIELRCSVNVNGQSLTIQGFDLFCFQLGA